MTTQKQSHSQEISSRKPKPKKSKYLSLFILYLFASSLTYGFAHLPGIQEARPFAEHFGQPKTILFSLGMGVILTLLWGFKKKAPQDSTDH